MASAGHLGNQGRRSGGLGRGFGRNSGRSLVSQLDALYMHLHHGGSLETSLHPLKKDQDHHRTIRTTPAVEDLVESPGPCQVPSGIPRATLRPWDHVESPVPRHVPKARSSTWDHAVYPGQGLAHLPSPLGSDGSVKFLTLKSQSLFSWRERLLHLNTRGRRQSAKTSPSVLTC